MAGSKITELSKKESSIEQTESKNGTRMSPHPQQSSAILGFKGHSKTAATGAWLTLVIVCYLKGRYLFMLPETTFQLISGCFLTAFIVPQHLQNPPFFYIHDDFDFVINGSHHTHIFSSGITLEMPISSRKIPSSRGKFKILPLK